MQSLASLMSMKQSDIGNLDDFDDGDDEAVEDRRSGGLGSGPAALLTGELEETLEEHSRVYDESKLLWWPTEVRLKWDCERSSVSNVA